MKSLLVCAALLTLPASALAADPRNPTVVELFQSQGCSSCPPALANVNALADRADVLALTFAVTYWDQLGWKDTLASPAFTARQWDYARAAGRGQVATPQTIVDGRTAINGGNRTELERTVAAAHRSARPVLSHSGQTVTVGGAAATAPATIWLVRYDPRTIQVAIRAGENGGKTLAHRNVVRALVSLGTWRGAAVRVTVAPSPDPAWRTAILVQQTNGGPILAAGRL
ncbi:DUF1223 domain-containing protein [Sphingomonas sp.]|uniref:DUF1223 domain-containing protein n=1 Tax=Sphingomonas sp. TaxID=28214 RepID=UPI003B00A33A